MLAWLVGWQVARSVRRIDDLAGGVLDYSYTANRSAYNVTT